MNSNQLRPICEILADLVTGTKISNMFSSLKLSCTLDERNTKWKRLFDAVANNWNKTHTNNALIEIIEWIMEPSLYIDNQKEFNEAKDKLNQRLSFIGLELLPTGKIQARSIATTLDEANQTVNKLKADLQRFNIHPQIIAFCKPEIISENLFHLVLEASKCLLEELRHISGLTTDGNILVNASKETIR